MKFRFRIFRFSRCGILAGLVTALVPLAVAAQDPLSRAFDLERRGSYAQAVEIYKSVLKDRPADVAALLGLERSLTPVSRLA